MGERHLWFLSCEEKMGVEEVSMSKVFATVLWFTVLALTGFSAGTNLARHLPLFQVYMVMLIVFFAYLVTLKDVLQGYGAS